MTVVPWAAISRKREVPKSATLAMPDSLTSTLPGRRSRWMMPWSCAWSTALQIWQVKSRARDRSSAPSRSAMASSVSPATYSITMKNTSSMRSAVSTVTMLGWLSVASSRGSRSSSPKSRLWRCGTFSATFLSIQVSSARKTVPKPPLPSGERILYLPTTWSRKNIAPKYRRCRRRQAAPTRADRRRRYNPPRARASSRAGRRAVRRAAGAAGRRGRARLARAAPDARRLTCVSSTAAAANGRRASRRARSRR